MNKQIRLDELITAKYGEQKYWLGKELTAQWLGLRNDVELSLCAADKGNHTIYVFTSMDIERLRQFFGLKSVDELYK